MTDFYSILPHLNATLNASSFVLLSSGYFFIKRKRVIAHRNCQILALSASVLFLISYIVYHAHHGVTRFAGQGIARPVGTVTPWTTASSAPALPSDQPCST